jgi:hypothetical protein
MNGVCGFFGKVAGWGIERERERVARYFDVQSHTFFYNIILASKFEQQQSTVRTDQYFLYFLVITKLCVCDMCAW